MPKTKPKLEGWTCQVAAMAGAAKEIDCVSNPSTIMTAVQMAMMSVWKRDVLVRLMIESRSGRPSALMAAPRGVRL
jgi:hypothetical protein